MSCEFCNHIDGHACGCPNYTPKKAVHYCSVCKEGIYYGEEYIENVDGDYAHYDCVSNFSYRKMIEWVGGKIEIMEDNYGENY